LYLNKVQQLMRLLRSSVFSLDIRVGFGIILLLFASLGRQPSVRGDTLVTLLTTNLSQNRLYLAAAAEGGLILFAGGYNDPEYSAVVDMFDTSTRTWLAPTNLSQPRGFLAGAAAGSLVLFAGGFEESESEVVDVYDTSTRTWLSPTALSQPRFHLVGVSTRDLILFGCGQASGEEGL
jgi:hypothetical protein